LRIRQGPPLTARETSIASGRDTGFRSRQAGDKLADFGAGGGYFTRLFADVVGPKGRVYAIEPGEVQKMSSVSKTPLNCRPSPPLIRM